jgi:RNA polymerase sigma-70 factor (ECF subfamily)
MFRARGQLAAVVVAAVLVGGAGLLASVLRADGGADELTPATVPPVVVKTVPQAGSDGVDPKLTEIKVTFSKDMLADSWSWVAQTRESFPKMTGKPKYLDDKRTCVLPVQLEPGKTYVLWVNRAQFGNNFKDADGRSAVPYLLVFQTKK